MTQSVHTTVIRVSLNRAHKIVERLASLMQALRVSMVQAANPISVTSALNGPQAKQLQTMQEAILADIQLFELMVTTHANLRASIAEANVQAGVSKLLAKIEGNNRMKSLASTLASRGPTPGTYSLNNVKEVTFVPDAPSSEKAVQVFPLSAENAACFQQQANALEREAFLLADSLADANAYRVPLEIPTELMGKLGL